MSLVAPEKYITWEAVAAINRMTSPEGIILADLAGHLKRAVLRIIQHAQKHIYRMVRSWNMGGVLGLSFIRDRDVVRVRYEYSHRGASTLLLACDDRADWVLTYMREKVQYPVTPEFLALL